MKNDIFFDKPKSPTDVWDVVIIGSGPAGLTAALYTTRGAASTLLLAGETWGGQLMLTSIVDNYPGFPEGVLGPELMERMKNQAIRFGTEFVPEDVTTFLVDQKPFEIRTADKKFFAKTIIVATGAKTNWLLVPGEKELIGKGVSSCAPCDAPFFKDKKVAVVGGGDSAMEEALVLTKYASEVTIIHRREELKASAIMQEKVKSNPKVKFIWNTEILEVKGTDKLERVILLNNKTQEKSELALDGLFVAIGHSPASIICQGNLELDDLGFVKIFGHTKTSVEGIFVAGDVHDMHYKQAITAAGFGCMAAFDALRFLDKTDYL